MAPSEETAGIITSPARMAMQASLPPRPDGLAFLNLAEKLVKSVEMP